MYAIVLAAAIFPAGWFGPSNYQQCVDEYAAKNATSQLVQFGARACLNAFDPAGNVILRARWLCYAKALTGVQTEMGARLMYTSCEQEHPDPACAPGNVFNYATNACEVSCIRDQLLNRATGKCEWHCPPGWAGNEETKFCVPPQASAETPASSIKEQSPSADVPEISLDLSHEPQRQHRATRAPTCMYEAVMTDAEIAACRQP